jgi:hypothetical protein
MPNYTIVATRTTEYEIDAVDFPDEQAALASLNDWIADDFEEYAVQGTWDFEVLAND